MKKYLVDTNIDKARYSFPINLETLYAHLSGIHTTIPLFEITIFSYGGAGTLVKYSSYFHLFPAFLTGKYQPEPSNLKCSKEFSQQNLAQKPNTYGIIIKAYAKKLSLSL